MKNILVPTDFSDCAQNATVVAQKLAQKFVSVVHFHHSIPEGTSVDTLSIKAEFNKIKTAFGKHNIVVKTEIGQGDLVSQISQIVQKEKIDMIIMGSHGVSGINELLIGSNTQKVVRSIHLPILVIKDPLENLDFKNIVFASNYNESEKGAFLRVVEFAKHFDAKLHLVAVRSTGIFNMPRILLMEVMRDFRDMAEGLECSIHFYRNISVETGIRLFSKNINADLITISNFEKHPVKRMLMGSNVEALINHSKLPVLSIDF